MQLHRKYLNIKSMLQHQNSRSAAAAAATRRRRHRTCLHLPLPWRTPQTPHRHRRLQRRTRCIPSEKEALTVHLLHRCLLGVAVGPNRKSYFAQEHCWWRVRMPVLAPRRLERTFPRHRTCCWQHLPSTPRCLRLRSPWKRRATCCLVAVEPNHKNCCRLRSGPHLQCFAQRCRLSPRCCYAARLHSQHHRLQEHCG